MGVLNFGDESVRNAVLFDQCNIWIGTQLVQVIRRKFPSIPVDDVKLVGNRTRGGCNLALDEAEVGSTRGTLLEGDDVPAGGSIRNLRNSEKGRGHGKDRKEESGESKQLVRKHAESLCGPKERGSVKGMKPKNKNEGGNWILGR